MLRHETTFRELRVHIFPIDLDHKVDKRLVLHCRDRRVFPAYLFSFDVSMEHDMVAHGQAHAHFDVRKLKPEDIGIMRDLNFRLELETYLTIFVFLECLQGAFSVVRLELLQ